MTIFEPESPAINLNRIIFNHIELLEYIIL